MFTSTTIKTIVVAAAAAAALTVAGCSNGTSTSSSTSSSPAMSGSMPGMDHGGMSMSTSTSASAAPNAARSDFNDADVTFLQMMYPHHAQAVDMAKLVAGRSQNQQVITLAQNIEKAQGPEMTQMTGLLESFGKPAPTADSGHTGMDMSGMMSAEQMTSLEGLSGAEFDRMWLQMMIDHHTGAIDMSNTELRDGSNADAKKMAQAIIANQEAEITQMRGMLNG
jgi:uncharacterized protein (DUF305 family)